MSRSEQYLCMSGSLGERFLTLQVYALSILFPLRLN